jgi:hypothetical protein
VSTLGGGIHSYFLEFLPPIFPEAGGKFYIDKEGKKINNCNKFSLFDKNRPCFSNPRIDTECWHFILKIWMFYTHMTWVRKNINAPFILFRFSFIALLFSECLHTKRVNIEDQTKQALGKILII